MEEIADWLEKLGMSEYTQSFTEHGIDVSVLRDLTDQDLKDIGMPLGQRRKILAASVSLPPLPRRHPNSPPERSRAPTPPNAGKSRRCSPT